MSDRHIDIDERDIRVTCPKCGQKHTWEWNHSNGPELTFSLACEACDSELQVYMQIGAVLTTGDDFEEEGWL